MAPRSTAWIDSTPSIIAAEGEAAVGGAVGAGVPAGERDEGAAEHGEVGRRPASVLARRSSRRWQTLRGWWRTRSSKMVVRVPTK